jgi:hypothetical protein
MPDEADGTGVPRSRLCELAEVEQRKHGRWVDDGLVPKKTRYGRLDLIRALTLDELRIRVGPKSMRAVWDQIAQDLVIPSRQLDVIVDLAQDEASLVATPKALAAKLPRNTKVVVIDVGRRAQHALARYDAYTQRHEGESGAGDEATADDAIDLAAHRRAPGP